jgi:hypothetical protein
MTKTFTAIREQVLDGADLLIDFATLGEYGLEPVAQEKAECRPEPCAPGRVHASTALQRRAERLERFAA